MNEPRSESALVVLAPEAEPLVRDYRMEFDPAAALGVPAHVSVLFPFLPPALVAAARPRLAALFAEFDPFDYTLAALGRFPGVLYLSPEPAAPFQALTRRVAEVFPDYPPYGGKFKDIVPHLTVAELADAARLDEVAARFQAACGPHLPLALRAEAVVLLDHDDGVWRANATFRLGV
jgi:hypothetical protein